MKKQSFPPPKPMTKLNFLALAFKLFRLSGFWPLKSKKNEFSERLYMVYTVLAFSIQFSLLFILVFGIFLVKWTSLDEAVEDIVVLSTCECLFHLFTIFCLKLVVTHPAELLQELLQDNINRNLNSPSFLADVGRPIAKSCAKHDKYLVKYFPFFGYSTTILYTVSSIIEIFSSSNADGYALPLKLFYKPKGTFFYITYVYEVIAMINCCHIGTLFDALFSSIAFCISEQFEILKKRASKWTGFPSKQFIMQHNNVLSLVKKLEVVYGEFVILELLLTSGLLCLRLIQMTQTGKKRYLLYMKGIVYVLGKIIQMMLYCWYGDRIIEKSFSVSYAVYFGSWHKINNWKNYSSDLIMVMRRAQKPLPVRGGTYVKLSLPTMASVFHAAYSLFMVLRSFR